MAAALRSMRIGWRVAGVNVSSCQLTNRMAVRTLHRAAVVRSEEAFVNGTTEDMIPKDALKDVDLDVPVIVEGQKLYSPKVEQLAEEILTLNLLETADLCDLLKNKLNVNDDAMFFPMPNLSGMMVAGPAGDAGAAAEAEPVVEKTHFDLKLVSFDPKSKIKIIKEVRAATKLGLKEAKDLVEGAPATLMTEVKAEDAEPLKAKLEELGAHVELE